MFHSLYLRLHCVCDNDGTVKIITTEQKRSDVTPEETGLVPFVLIMSLCVSNVTRLHINFVQIKARNDIMLQIISTGEGSLATNFDTIQRDKDKE